MERGLAKHTKQGRFYKQAYTKKSLSPKNVQERLEYAKYHLNKSIEDFWSRVIFTDEAHFDPSSRRAGMILREAGHRYDEENIEERPPLQGNALHFAA